MKRKIYNPRPPGNKTSSEKVRLNQSASCLSSYIYEVGTAFDVFQFSFQSVYVLLLSCWVCATCIYRYVYMYHSYTIYIL